MKYEINPKWLALEGKNYGIPLCQLPDNYKIYNCGGPSNPNDPLNKVAESLGKWSEISDEKS